MKSEGENKMIWSLSDFRRWWMSASRLRWKRAIGRPAGRDLSNYGDLV